MAMDRTIWADLLGAAVSYCDAKGMRTRYIEAGNSEPLIFLHGSGGHAESFARNVMPLAAYFHTYAIDMAGHGFTDRHPTLAGTDGIVDHLLRFMDTLRIERVNLVGESLGGAASARFALEHPDRVLRIAFITGAGLEMGEEAAKLAASGREALQRLSAAALGSPTRESVRNRLAWLFVDPETSITDELVEVRYQIYKRRAELEAAAGESAARIGGGVGVELTPERLREIKVPFFFLWTDHNPSTPWQVAEMAHKQMPGSRFHVIKNAGHWPQYEQTEEFNRLLIDFLKS
ncbi:MAG: alpha/beta fold hydrolase [Chloroflexi bacterium]|nr:alpha/beta fold hydrolase [Chloroflexota bacterium]